MINRQLLQTLHVTFPSGHIIDLFNSLRREVIFREIDRLVNNEGTSSDILKELLIGLERNLCHPLLLPTAIAGCLAGSPLHEKLLTDFLEGNIANDFSQSWVRVSADLFDDTHQLAQFVEHEHQYYLGLYAFLLDSFKQGGKNMFAHCLHLPLIEQLIETGYEETGIREFKKKYGFSLHVLRRNAWVIFNTPMAYCSAGLGSEREAGIFYKYGFDNNSFWHNTTNLAEYDFEQAKRIFNESVRLSDRKMTIEAAEKLKICEYLLRRTRRLYWWNPCETDAHDAADTALEILFKEYKDHIGEG